MKVWYLAALGGLLFTAWGQHDFDHRHATAAALAAAAHKATMIRLCALYYEQREVRQATDIDYLCFDFQEMKP